MHWLTKFGLCLLLITRLIMSYALVEFYESEGGGVAIVYRNWLTPRKREVLWPPLKDQRTFDKYIVKNVEAESDWKLYEVTRCLYETDDFSTAKKKLKLSEQTSDLQTDVEDGSIRKRRRLLPQKLILSDSSDEERPPPLKASFKNKLFSRTVEQDCNRDISISPYSYSGCSLETTADQTENTETQSPTTKINCLRIQNIAATEISDTISDICNTPRNTPGGSGKSTPSIIRHIDKTDVVGQNFQEKVVGLLSFIREQNYQMLALLKQKDGADNSIREFPINFPMKIVDDVNCLEDILRGQKEKEILVAILSNIGGRDHSSRTSRILKYILLDSLATKIAFMEKEQTNFSGFPFENYLSSLKNLIRSPHKPLQQIVRRLSEIDDSHVEIRSTDIAFSLEFNNGPHPGEQSFLYKMFKKLKYKQITFHIISYRSADCYCYINGNILIQIHNILVKCDDNAILLYGKKFKKYSSFYIYPCESENIDIFSVSDMSNEFEFFLPQDITAKCMLLPDGTDKWISLPLIHEIQ